MPLTVQTPYQPLYSPNWGSTGFPLILKVPVLLLQVGLARKSSTTVVIAATWMVIVHVCSEIKAFVKNIIRGRVGVGSLDRVSLARTITLTHANTQVMTLAIRPSSSL